MAGISGGIILESAAMAGGGDRFFGWRVMWAAFVLAAFGWGLGFYSPPVFLHAVTERTGWQVDQVSVAVTVHFLSGALVVANMPRLVRWIGIAPIIAIGVTLVAGGMVGWSIASERWQLFVAAAMTGSGWVTMSAAGINAILAPWFNRKRPVALSMAYNGAGLGGAVIAPLWAFMIPAVGFDAAALILGGIAIVVVWFLAWRYFARTPQSIGQNADGEGSTASARASPAVKEHAPLPGGELWRNWAFLTLAVGMAVGLFAQVGLVSHLFSMLVPVLGVRGAGLTMGAATAMSIAGRMLLAWSMPPGADRRIYAGISYGVQIAGSVLFALFADTSAAVAVLAALLFGCGIGNVTSMPPLIAQMEFAPGDVLRVVSLVVAMSQALSAFAPTVLGFVRGWSAGVTWLTNPEYGVVFGLAALAQSAAIIAFLAGRAVRS